MLSRTNKLIKPTIKHIKQTNKRIKSSMDALNQTDPAQQIIVLDVFYANTLQNINFNIIKILLFYMIQRKIRGLERIIHHLEKIVHDLERTKEKCILFF